MDSGAVTLPNELVEGRVVHYPFHPLLAQDNGRDVDVAGFSRQVLRCLAATDGIVECRTAVTGTDDDGLTGIVAQGFEYDLAQCLEVPYYGLVCFTEGLRLLLMPLARRGRGGMVWLRKHRAHALCYSMSPIPWLIQTVQTVQTPIQTL